MKLPAILLALCTTAAAAQQPVQKGCSIVRTVNLFRADTALHDGKYEDAEALYTKMLPSSIGIVGVERALLGEHKLNEAIALAQKESDAKPTDALLLQGLGEVRYRRGEMVEATLAYNKSTSLDPCLARTHYDLYRYLNLEGKMKSAQNELETAYKLSPGDTLIARVWQYSHRTPPTDAERIASYQKRADKPDLPADQKAAYLSAIKAVESHERGDCQLVNPVEKIKVSMTTIGNASHLEANGKAALELQFNGKKRYLEIDTGASGISITREAAKSLGLTPEVEVSSGGFGDEGPRATFITHVQSIKIGQMEFQNCQVRVYEAKNVMQGKDGLIGPDVFRDFVVTLDFPAMDLKLGPLPRRPDESAGKKRSLGTDDDEDPSRSYADAKTDPYVAPEMAKWTKVYRSGHFLIMPASIGKAPRKLFILDTGAGTDLISASAAREVTGLTKDDQIELRGVSGKVNDVAVTGRMEIQFAGFRLREAGFMSIDMSRESNSVGLEIAGFLGYPTLGQLKMEIDYRDNLVNITYADRVNVGR